MGPDEFQILQDFGNGWVAARGTLGSSALMFVNLYQTPVLFPRDERGAASRPGAVGPWPPGASHHVRGQTYVDVLRDGSHAL